MPPTTKSNKIIFFFAIRQVSQRKKKKTNKKLIKIKKTKTLYYNIFIFKMTTIVLLLLEVERGWKLLIRMLKDDSLVCFFSFLFLEKNNFDEIAKNYHLHVLVCEETQTYTYLHPKHFLLYRHAAYNPTYYFYLLSVFLFVYIKLILYIFQLWMRKKKKRGNWMIFT